MTTYVILGYKLDNNNKIHPILKKRLDKFIKIYKTGDKVILSGGKRNKKNNKTESYIMSKYLLDKITISKKNIILENKANDTIENIKFLLKILKKENIKNISLITSSWHMKRVKYIIKNILKNHNEKNKFTFHSSRILNPPDKDEKIQLKKEKQKLINLKRIFLV